MKKERMYEIEGKRVATWNPYVGCRHNCTYCYARDIAKRQKHRCQKCYDFVPHFHPERLKRKFKPSETVFVCSMGDIAFATAKEEEEIMQVVSNHPETTFMFQSKDPLCFLNWLWWSKNIPNNCIFGATIETNRDTGAYSKAPPTYIRKVLMCSPFMYPRTYVTIEPIMDFDMGEILSWIDKIKPEFVYIGYNSRDSKNKHLPEPSLAKTEALIAALEKITEVRLKLIRKAWWEK